MNVEEIRQLRRAHPFKPFYLVLNDGRKLPVDQPNSLAIAPDGKLMAFQTLDSWFEQLSPERVTSIDFEINTGEVQRQRMLGWANRG